MSTSGLLHTYTLSPWACGSKAEGVYIRQIKLIYIYVCSTLFYANGFTVLLMSTVLLMRAQITILYV